MTPTQDLIKLVKGANREQVDSMIYDFNNLGYYREDKRQRKNYIIQCLQNTYTRDIGEYGIDSDSLRMEQSVIRTTTGKRKYESFY